MSESSLRPSQRAWWQRFFVYTLFIFSTFSIAGDEASIMLLMALALWQWAREGRGAWQGLPEWLLGAFLVLPAVAIVSAFANPDPLTTLDHLRYHYRWFLPLALVPALAAVNLRKALLWLLVPMGLMAVYGIIQYRYGVDWFRPEGEKLITPYAGGRFNGKGNFTHHLTYAGYMLILVPFLLALAGQARGRERWAWVAGSALAAAATVVSLGRSGWLGMVVGLLVLAAVRLPRRWAIAVGATGVTVIAVTAVLLSTGWLQERVYRPGVAPIVQRLVLTGLTFDKDRLHLWESGWLAVQDKPLLGHGWGNQDPALEPYRQAVSAKYGGYRFLVKASAGLHNIYLQMTFAVGVIGLLAYLYLWAAMFGWSAIHAARAGPDYAWEQALLHGAIGGLAGSMVAGSFENNFLDGEVQTLILTVMGIALYAGLRIRRALAPPAVSAGAFTP